MMVMSMDQVAFLVVDDGAYGLQVGGKDISVFSMCSFWGWESLGWIEMLQKVKKSGEEYQGLCRHKPHSIRSGP